MADLNPITLWKRFLALPNDSRTKTLGIAFLVALVCATAVSVTAVTLKPMQEGNLARERDARMAGMIAALPGMAEILRESGAETLETVIVDLEAGAPAKGIGPTGFDYLAAQSDPDATSPIPPDADPAGIGRRPNLAPAYLLRDGDRLVLAVIPAYGRGYQSTIRAYVALEGDLDTIAAVTVYEQGETPGLGTRIADPAWLDGWRGRQTRDPAGGIALAVVRNGAAGPFEIDAISGATRSSLGVSNLVRFWLGEYGFGPFLDRLRAEEP